MKRFFWFLFVAGTIFLVIVYLLSCLTPLFSADGWVVMGYLGLGFPFLLLTLLFTAVVWLFYNKRITLILLGIAALGSYHISHLFAWHQSSFTLHKASGTVRVMGWNIQNFSHDSIPHKRPDAVRFRIMRYLRQQQPDIICIQDFTQFNNRSFGSNLAILSDSLQLPFYIYSNTYQDKAPWSYTSSGVAIFSRYPLHNARRILYSGKKWPEGILQADVTIDGTTHRIITTHFQSMYLKNQHPQDKLLWARDEDSAINYSGSLFKKLNHYFPYHARQAQEVRRIIEDSPYPVIFSADMNEVPSSYCYGKVRGDLKDAFLQKANGLGQTYYRFSPTLRIDYLFTSPGTEIVQYRKDTPNLSDHYPQTIDLKW